MTTIYVAGHRGLVGSAIVRKLNAGGIDALVATSETLDLRVQSAVDDWFAANKIDQVYLAAAKVGGIQANDTYAAEFIHENLVIQSNVIHSAWKAGVSKLLFLGSSCIYPKLAPQPLREDSLLTGPLESSNQWYAIAKIAGIKMCQAYRKQYGFNAISAMPTNLYGPGDNFNLDTSHVLPALIRKFHEANEAQDASVTIWGSGKPQREFLHVDDLADACVFLMNNYDESEIINVGWGQDISIKDLAEMIGRTIGYRGELKLDNSKPDGTPRKLLDVSKLKGLGWEPSISLSDGIAMTWDWYRSQQESMFEKG